MTDVRNSWDSHEVGDSLHSRTMVMNMGPSHPATHGTIRLILELDGERAVKVDVDPGYLHRGFEKQCENCDYNQVVPYTDRLNYVSPIINNVGYCIAIEKLFGVRVPERCEYIRVIVSELSRICDHLTCCGAASMELGAFTVMLYLMQAREDLYDLIEMVTGARLTISYCRVGGLRHDLPPRFAEEFFKRLEKMRQHVADTEALLSRNRIFADRMCDIGVMTAEEAINYGVTGPMLRATGVNYDVRKAFPYSSYEKFDFNVPLGKKGDCFDRFNVRIEEIKESFKIIEQALNRLPDGPVNLEDPRIIMRPKDEVYGSIEGMISQFEIVFGGPKPPPGDVYFPCEGGNGEVGFYVVSDGTGQPYRCRVRPPSFLHMGIAGPLMEGHMLSDLVPIFGTINMIGGECDR